MATEYIGSTCPSCGQTTLRYNPGQNKLICNSCKFEQSTPQKSYKVTNRPLSKGVNWDRLDMGLSRDDGIEVQCGNCKSLINFDEDLKEDFACVFCGHEEYEKTKASEKIVRPWGLAPFNIPKRRAFEILDSWITDDWIGRYFFYPRDFLKFAKLEELRGVYIPYWSYKASAKATYYVFAGYKAKENQKRWKKEDLRWVPKNIYFENTFNEVFVPASNGVAADTLGEIFDFSDKDVYKDINGRIVPYRVNYLKEFDVELYQKEMKSGLEVVDAALNSQIINASIQRAKEEGMQDHVPIDFPEKPALSAAKEGITFHHILLPVWIAIYKYKGQEMPFVISGLHGKMTGERPFDNRRFGILAGLAAILILLLVLLVDGCT